MNQGILTRKTYYSIDHPMNTYIDYYLEGDKVVHETDGKYAIYFTYDVDGTLISMNYDKDITDGVSGIEYFYIRNLQGDIIKLVDARGNVMVEYQYDAWGNIIYQTDNDIAKKESI